VKTKPGGEIEALRQVVRDASAEPAPEVDWERIEARLFADVEKSRPQTARGGSWRWMGALAAAAAVLLVSLGVLQNEPEPIVTAPTAAPAARVIGPDVASPVDGTRLAIGDRVVSGARELSVEHPGLASWTLSPSSKAALADNGERLTVRLEAGAVLSRVVPSSKKESFAIVTGDVRVAVHGTVFRVERKGERALVEVTEGVVAVGPAAVGPTDGWLLRAGDRGSFSLDGKTGTVQRATASLDPVLVEGSPYPVKRAHPAPANLPGAPTTAELENGLDVVAARVSRCFDDHTSSGDVRVQARTRLAAEVRPDGTIGSLSFDPPLAPEVQKCAQGAQRAAKFPQSQHGAVVERTILLGP
jgi:hypothetical protein